MKEIKVTIKLTVFGPSSDKELLDEIVYDELQCLMEEGALEYAFKAVEVDEEDEEEIEEDEDF